ncbi:MAG: 50S ribosomal protein L35 [Armatimonadetes bacterium]|nr:50S ribosomal protein L35 [Armatimonadota bacterium]
MQSRSKCKTQKTAAKRVSRTGTGKLRIRHAFKGHLLTRKSSTRLRRLRKPGIVSAADRRAFERLVPPTH